ncbi:uncharacterized protein A4U43_C10F16520 [Asparagus officinalis]|uniref:Major facilitator superfamily (MFS) profile domain-containing protein n=1 Tax=Asparagus officinalis TaxID=4686 RepID=A0A5P1E382_ASPOF|nr:protein NRT1/ PTR FAMILY 4.4-like [Asparagus officinalis]ONK57091.1 uncharacterized protein A4U43_C10F16520 [Asparagus officinalis]
MEVERTRESLDGDGTSSDQLSFDWRGRPCNPNKHGGMRAASFVLGLQAFEIMAIAAVGNNLITYVFNEMHFPLSKSANIVTNFIGTVFLLSLLGGFLSDSYLGCFKTMLVFGLVELSGFLLLSIQAHLPQLKPPKCNMMAEGEHCLQAKGYKASILFLALYLIAMGSGCLKPNMISHGADQFTKHDPNQSRKLSTYFNTAYFSFCAGEMMALTVVVWIQTHSGMDIGFGVSAVIMAIGLISLMCGMVFYSNKPPQGSIFAPIARVFFSAITERKQICTSHADKIHHSQNIANYHLTISGHESSSNAGNLHAHKFRFLDKACTKSNSYRNKHKPCTESGVKQAKTLLSLIPIFACTIIFNTILAQLQTFSVQQGRSMNTQIFNSFQIPPASLQSIPYLMLIILVPIYETTIIPLARRLTSKESGISPLNRIGIGLFTVTFSMVSAAVIEKKRRNLAIKSNEMLSIFWIAPQFLVFGLSEMFTAVGLIEFFYKQSLGGMQAFCTAMTYCSYSFGFFLSSLLVSLVNKVTDLDGSSGGWLNNNDLNKDRLDLFYWMLAGLSLLNFFNYLFWSRWYSYFIPVSYMSDHCIEEKSEDAENRTSL